MNPGEIFAGGTTSSLEALDKTYYVMLPPELCLVHPLPGPLVRGAQRLPSVMRRVESMLLAIQLKHEIAYPIPAIKVKNYLHLCVNNYDRNVCEIAEENRTIEVGFGY